MPATNHENRLRQIAVLVASVDADAARQILLSLPSEIARQIRALSSSLGPIPAEERRALLAEFQKSQAASPLSQPNLTPSQTTRAATTREIPASGRYAAESSITADKDSSDRWQEFASANEPLSPGWTQMGVEALVRFVKHERPNLVATIIHQLPAHQGAQLLQRLPRHLVKDTLRCLGTLREVDSETKQELDTHLTQRLEEYYQSLQHHRENTRRINDLLSAAPADLKQQWASWLRPDEFADPEEAVSDNVQSFNPTVGPLSTDSLLTGSFPTEAPTISNTSNRSRTAQVAMAGIAPDNILPFAKGVDTQTISASQPGSHQMVDQYYGRHDGSLDTDFLDHTLVLHEFERILELKRQLLASLLSSLDSQTILLALAGATPGFMKRFYAMLEPADAKVLQNRIKRIGPVHLRDIDRAQMRIIESCRRLQSPSNLSRAA